MKRAVAYIRVSSEDQVKNFSLSNQEDYCRSYANRNNFDLIRFYKDEGKSAKNINRPGLIKMLADCQLKKNKIDAVLVYKVDRLSRNTKDGLEVRALLVKHGVRVISVTEPIDDSPTGRFQELLLMGIAELDNEVRSERTKDGMKKRWEAGLVHGKAPLGYRNVEIDGKKTVEFDDCAKDIQWLFNEFSKGTLTTRTAAIKLNARGVRVKVGKRVNKVKPQQVHRVLHNKFYLGVLESRWGERFGVHKPLIDENTFFKVQAILSGKSVSAGKLSKIRIEFPLRGLLYCPVCEQRLTGAFSKGRNKRYPYYFCLNNCVKSLPVEKVDNLFSEYLQQIKPKEKLAKAFVESLQDKIMKRFKDIDRHQEARRKEIEELKVMKDRLIEAHLKGFYTDEEMKERKSALEVQILGVRIPYNDLKINYQEAGMRLDFLLQMLIDLDKTWRNSTLEQKRILFGSIFPEKVYFDNWQLRTARLAPWIAPISDIENTTASLGVAAEIEIEPIIQSFEPAYMAYLPERDPACFSVL